MRQFPIINPLQFREVVTGDSFKGEIDIADFRVLDDEDRRGGRLGNGAECFLARLQGGGDLALIRHVPYVAADAVLVLTDPYPEFSGLVDTVAHGLFVGVDSIGLQCLRIGHPALSRRPFRHEFEVGPADHLGFPLAEESQERRVGDDVAKRFILQVGHIGYGIEKSAVEVRQVAVFPGENIVPGFSRAVAPAL